MKHVILKQFQSRYRFYRQSNGTPTGSCVSSATVKISVQEPEEDLLWENSGKLHVNLLSRSVHDIFILSNSEKTTRRLIKEEHDNMNSVKKFKVEKDEENKSTT
jgi:hypothetical protein